jgi:hypothetical protein
VRFAQPLVHAAIVAGKRGGEAVAPLREAFARGQVPALPRGLTAADFSKARAPKNAFGVQPSIQLQDAVAERCLFDRAGKFLRLPGRFTGCGFRKTTTRSAALLGRMNDCDFCGANLHVASWSCVFRACSFAEAGIHDVCADLRAVGLAAERVRFAATMNRVIPGLRGCAGRWSEDRDGT